MADVNSDGISEITISSDGDSPPGSGTEMRFNGSSYNVRGNLVINVKGSVTIRSKGKIYLVCEDVDVIQS